MPIRHSRLPVAAAIIALSTAVLVPTGSGADAAVRTRTAPHATTDYSFDDEFIGSAGQKADPSLWTYQTGGNWNGGTQAQQYTSRPDNAALTGDGTLLITAKSETFTGADGITRDYTSARLMSKPALSYGRLAARIRMTGAQGAWPSFWTVGANYPQVGWPRCGEIDVMEAVNDYPNLYASFHGPYTPDNGRGYNAGSMIPVDGGLANAWHIYAVRWTPKAVTWTLDGRIIERVMRADLPANTMWALDSPQNIILNVAVGGWPGNAPPSSSLLATMEVDWVRATAMPTT